MGQYLVRILAQVGANVTILAHKRPVPTTVADIKETGLSQVRVFQGDVCDFHTLRHLVAEQEVIYALAGKSGTVQSNQDPVQDLSVNCQGLLNLLEACRINNPSARIVFPSSRLVYSKTEALPVSETYPTEPRSIYGIHKLTSEKYLSLYYQLYGLPTVTLRITNPYGFEQQPVHFTHGIINEFFRKALRGEPLSVFGNGRQIRDYVYIEDVLQALLAAGSHPAAIGQVFNVGSGQGVALAEIAEEIVGLVGCGHVQYEPWPADYLSVETGDFVADIGKIHTILGWLPQTSWHAGLGKIHTQWLDNKTYELERP